MIYNIPFLVIPGAQPEVESC